MNADCFYEKAHGRHECGDYSIADSRCVVVCDGCSSVANSHMGARLLAWTANLNWETFLALGDKAYMAFGQRVIEKTRDICGQLNVGRYSWDATLILAFVAHSQVYVWIYGDGFIIFKNHDQDKQAISIRFEDEMPYYLSYWIDQARLRTYQEYFEKRGRYAKSCRIWSSENNMELPVNPVGYKFEFSFPLHDLEWLCIATDGFRQFVKKDTGVKLNAIDILHNFTDFKSRRGRFIKRRANRAVKDYDVAGFKRMDDIALAGFCFTET